MRARLDSLDILARLALVVLVAGFLGGCGIFSPDESTENDGGGGGGEPFPVAVSPDALISNFIRSYEERNFEEYDNLLHNSFVFYFAPEDIDLSPAGQGFWERADDVESTRRMFRGETGTRPNGEAQPGVQQITLRLNPLEPTWTDASGEGPEFEGSLKRRYAVDMTVSYTSSDLISEVTGEQVFYVKSELREIDGAQQPVYQLRFWKDLGRPLGKTLEGSI